MERVGSIYRPCPARHDMAKRRGRSRKYKIVNVATADMGAAGDQVLIGKIKKLDAQGPTGYLHNVQLSVLVDDAESDNIGFIWPNAVTSVSAFVLM